MKKTKTKPKTKSGAKAPATKTAASAPKPVAKQTTKPASVKQAVVHKAEVPAVVQQHREGKAVRIPSPATVLTDALARVTAAPPETPTISAALEPVAKPASKRTAKPVAATVTDPNGVTCRKTNVRTGDIAEGDTDKGGRFEVLLGEVKIGEVAFCSIVRMRDGAPNGFKRSWRGEDTRGTVQFTEGKRMKVVVDLMVNAWRGVTEAPEAMRAMIAPIIAPADQVEAVQGASA